VAVDEAGQHRAAARVDVQVRARVGFEGGDAPAGQRDVAARERQLAGTVVAQVRQAVLRRAQHLRGAAQAGARRGPRVHQPPSIGMRTPSRPAASIASP
jgi:hypothetical protein